MADAGRSSRKRRRAGSEDVTEDENASQVQPDVSDSNLETENDDDASDDGQQPKQAFEPQTDFTEGELQVRRTRRGVYEGRKAEEEPIVPTSTAGRVRRRGNGRKRPSNQKGGRSGISRAQQRKQMLPSKPIVPDALLVFDLANEPAWKYDLRRIVDDSSDFMDWTSYQLKTRTMYFDTCSKRFELSRAPALSSHGYDQYMLSEIVNQRGMTVDAIQTLSVPLPTTHTQSICENLDWSELRWSHEGVSVRGNSLHIQSLRYLHNAQPTKHTLPSLPADLALQAAYKSLDKLPTILAAESRLWRSGVAPFDYPLISDGLASGSVTASQAAAALPSGTEMPPPAASGGSDSPLLTASMARASLARKWTSVVTIPGSTAGPQAGAKKSRRKNSRNRNRSGRRNGRRMR